MSERESGPSGLARFLPLIPAIVAGAVVAAWSWGSFPHPFIDFGREAYTPWRLSEGAVLYRDVAYFNGPFSPYWNAAVFALLGPGLAGLFVMNALWALFILVLLYHLLERVGGRAAAAWACGFFALTIAFTQMEPVGNDSYLAPYSHEITHGLALALATLVLAERWTRRGGRGALLATGFVLGLTALTKVELTLAAVGGVGTLLVFAPRADDARPRGVDAGWLALGAAAPVVLSIALLALAMPLSEAARGVAGSFAGALDRELVSQHFYRWTRGTLEPLANLRILAFWTLLLGSLVGVGTWLGHRFPRAGTPATIGSAFVTAAVLAFLPLDWSDAPRPLPILLAGLLVLALRRAPGAPPRDPLRIALLVFSGLLLLKIWLKVRLIQYGFVLAVPGLLLAIVAGLAWLPAWLRARKASDAFARGAVFGALLAATGSLLFVTSFYFDARSHPIGQGRDAFRTDARARQIVPALTALDRMLAPGEPLLVLPEGVLWNYLLRRPTPTPHINFMPPELALFGETETLAALQATPPRVIALVHKETDVYGVPLFGRDYAVPFLRWVERDYVRVARYGDPALRPGSRFGVELWRRRDAAPPAGSE